MAIALVLVGALCAAMTWRRLSVASVWAALAWLWVAATPAFAEWALGSLERQYPASVIEDMPAADVAIVLGGAVSQSVPPRVTLDLNASSDRVLHAARLYRAGKVRIVMVAGGNIPWLPGKTPEAELIRSLLIEWGVPVDAIAIAGASRNTYENALEVKELRQLAPFGSALLVTSAAHMPRAMAVFRKAGLPVTAATTDVEVVEGGEWTVMRWLPDASSLAMTTAAMKEWIGYWAYKARGYL